MITQNQAADIRKRVNAYDVWAKQFEQSNGWRVIPASELDNAPVKITNEDRGALEVFEFCTNKPDRYFAYVKTGIGIQYANSPVHGIVTTWLGDRLGDIVFSGKEYRSGFGDKRINIRARGINGVLYSGTYYKSAGDYCRLRKVIG